MNKLYKKLKIVFIIILVIFLGLWSVKIYNLYRFHFEKETRFMMDTFVTIYAVGPKEITSPAIDLALKRMQEIDIKFNPLNPKSQLYAFNHQNIPISDREVLKLIKVALEVSKESNGAFDITVAPLIELWGFCTPSPHLPQGQQIKNALKNVGYQHLLLKNDRLEKDNQGTMIDLGGIAKGYAISQAIGVLKAQGVTSALIDLGGDIYALGRKGNRLWKVGIKNPRREGILGYMEVEDLAVMGSGDYERFFMQDGKRYHHIFDPKTGYPTEGVISVTLMYDDPVLAQAWSKIPFILGVKKGLEMLERIPGMEVIIITSSGEKIYSSGFKHMLNVIPEIE